MFRIFTLLIVAFIFFNCRKPTEIVPVSGWSFAYKNNFNTSLSGVGNKDSLFRKSLVSSISDSYKAYLDTCTLPTVPATNPYVTGRDTCHLTVFRSRAQPFPKTGGLIGTPPDKIPIGLLNLITQGNKPLRDISKTDSIKAWLPVRVSYINSDGSLENISNRLNTDLVQSLSQMMVFFPDGYYLYFNLTDISKNSFGVYQMALDNENLPLGILYRQLASGEDFKQPPYNVPPTFQTWQGFGIWGISGNRFYPAILINAFPKTDVVVLTMQPVAF